MPTKPRHPCNRPGCPELTAKRFCPTHQAQHNRAAQQAMDAKRGSAAARGYGRRWQKVRLTYLRKHVFCVYCDAEARLTVATVVDHIRPHKGNQALFWDRSNWQALCKRCHDRKTATEGAFGHAAKAL